MLFLPKKGDQTTDQLINDLSLKDQRVAVSKDTDLSTRFGLGPEPFHLHLTLADHPK